MKYQGSKNRIAKDIIKVIEADQRTEKIITWVEPFVGGCNMIDKVKNFYRIGSDINPYLIEMFRALQKCWIPPENVDEAAYKLAKENSKLTFKTSVQTMMAEIGFIGVGCSFAGKWFGGYARGGTRNYCRESRENLLKQREKIISVNFQCEPYDKLDIPPNSIIYCDPPYQGTTKYRDSFNHKRFWEWCDSMVNEGHVVYVSEYQAPEGWFSVWQKEIVSGLDLNTGNKKAVEKLFTKYKKLWKEQS